MKKWTESNENITLQILNEDSNKILSKFITVGTFSGSAINFFSRILFTSQDKVDIITYSIFLVLLGTLSILLRFMKLNTKLVTHILSIILVSVMVTIILNFEYNGGITVWSISLLCLICAVTSIDKTTIVYNTVAAIFIEIYLWSRKPEMKVDLDPSDYTARIGIYILALIIALIVNNMFIERMRKNLKQIKDIKFKNNEIITLQEQIYKLVSESTSDGIWSSDLVNNKQVFSRWWLKELGFTEEEMVSMNGWMSLIHKNHINEVQSMYEAYIKHEIDHFESECRMKTKKGYYLWIKMKIKALFDKSGNPYMIVGTYSDITPLKEKEERLKRLAYYDSLTDLPNRQYFLDMLQLALDNAAIENTKLYVVFIDLDNFKKVNDSMGHFYGDFLLKEVANRFKHVVKEPCFLGRLGGDEFAIIVHEINNLQEVENFVQRLMNSLRKPIMLKNNRFVTSASFGISFFPQDGKRVEELLRNADTAMYRAKETGKNNFKLFNKSMEIALLKKVGIENRLLTAIDKNEFYLVYQPQISLSDNTIRGFEALIRWNNDELGIVQPTDFIPLAEETGYISMIGKWVLEVACLKFVRLQKEYNYFGTISVNISPIQFKSAGFVEMIKEVLKDTNFNPSYLELEVTESVFIDSFENAIAVFNELKKLGVKVSLDDFGTGYSSLSYLQQLPIDTLKIDKSFISGLNNDEHKKDIVKSIIALVHNLNLYVIAEGMETEEQLMYLKQSKCDNVQGYLFGKPTEQLESFLNLS
jgi:diguanylate cyclase (GGDEF)-like protein/PAS domain S-box-containing protein